MNNQNDDVYRMNGFSGREEYLATLCQEYDPDAVYTLADILGESEDFDGLISSLEDYRDCGFY